MPSSNGDAEDSNRASHQRPTSLLLRIVIVAVTVGACFVVGSAHWTEPATSIALVALIAVAGWLSIVDFEERRLPNQIVGPLAAAVTATVFVAGLIDGDLGRSGRAVLFGVAAAAVFLMANLLGGMGMGDVKYAYPVGTALGWFGLDSIVSATLTMVLIGGLAAVAVLVAGKGRHYRLPYGPFMSIGLIVGLITGSPGI